MTVLLGTMSLPAPEDADLVRTYLNGTHGSGGLWEALTRSSNHDHTGGANGKPISVSSIPDGSITTGKLDPSVLLPYALVDGSKPFTGAVTMEADATIRDTLYFGVQGAATPPDVTLQRTAAHALAADASLSLSPTVGQAALLSNGHAVITGAPSFTPLQLNRPEATGSIPLLSFSRAGTNKWYLGVANTEAFTLFTAALTVPLLVTPTGSLTLAPDAGLPALIGPAAADLIVQSPTSSIRVNSGANIFAPTTDNLAYCGFSGMRWAGVWAGTGTISTSAAAAKQDIAPLDPAACVAAVLETDWVSFTYLPPAYQGPEPDPSVAYDEHDSNEVKAEKRATREAAEAGAKAAALETLAATAFTRDQKGYVLGSAEHQTADLFGLSDRESTSVASDLAVVACALQDALTRIAALEAQP